MCTRGVVSLWLQAVSSPIRRARRRRSEGARHPRRRVPVHGGRGAPGRAHTHQKLMSMSMIVRRHPRSASSSAPSGTYASPRCTHRHGTCTSIRRGHAADYILIALLGIIDNRCHRVDNLHG
ncbi:hypothetical protein BS78_09G066400 [Paspalum vaginatum]|nr:hypothetical protein BS78_09G066400 [Paspalum vaginatum]